jgi:hypothetical protein
MNQDNIPYPAEKNCILSKTIENQDLLKYSLIGCCYQEKSEFVSRSCHPYRDMIIEYDGKTNFGKVSNISEKSFNIPREGLAIYVNDKYYDSSKLALKSYDETEDDNELIASKKKRLFDDIISDNDLYFKPSNYNTKRSQCIGKGLFTKKVISLGNRFPAFKGDVISVEAYSKKPLAQKGYGIQIKVNESIFDCYNHREICMASYANAPNHLIHSLTDVEPTANAICLRSTKDDAEGKPVFYLEAIRQIEIDEEVFWEYAEDDQYFN